MKKKLAGWDEDFMKELLDDNWIDDTNS
jgi:hypothetical protein